MIFDGDITGLNPKYGLPASVFVYNKGEQVEEPFIVETGDVGDNYGVKVILANKSCRYSGVLVGQKIVDGREYNIIVNGSPVSDFKELEIEYKKREFRSILVTKFIEKMDLFDDDSDNLKIELFCVTNYRNQENFIRGELPKNSIFTFPSLEAFKKNREFDVKDGFIIENKFKDFLVSNLVNYKLGYDAMSFKDFECYVNYKLEDLSQIDYTYNDINFVCWGFGFNKVLDFKFQTFYNSPSVLIKSISIYVRDILGFTDDELHRRRFNYVKSLKGFEDVKYHKYGQWSLCYRGKEFVDVSGHIINLIMLSCLSIVNFRGYLRLKIQNAYKPLIDQGVDFVSVNYDRIEGVEVNSEGRLVGLWHTYKEDSMAIDFVKHFIKELNLKRSRSLGGFYRYYLVETGVMEELINEVNYPNFYSIPVVHDKGLDPLVYYYS